MVLCGFLCNDHFGIKRQLRLTGVRNFHWSRLDNRLLLCFLRTPKHPSLLSFFSAKSEKYHITLMKREIFGTNLPDGKEDGIVLLSL